MGEQHTPGPWRVERGYSRTSWVVVRSVRPGYVQYLNAKGAVSGQPSRFRSEDAAASAIDKATRGAK